MSSGVTCRRRPVGCGESTTVVIDADTVLQIDLHTSRSPNDDDDDDDPLLPIVDELAGPLPDDADGRPYLGAFGAAHLDNDQTGLRQVAGASHDRRPVFTAPVPWGAGPG